MRVREESDANSEIASDIDRLQVVKCLEAKGDWYRVEHDCKFSRSPCYVGLAQQQQRTRVPLPYSLAQLSPWRARVTPPRVSRPISAKPGWVLKKNKVRELLNPIDHAEGEKKWLEQEEHFQFLKLPPKKQEAILKQKVR